MRINEANQNRQRRIEDKINKVLRAVGLYMEGFKQREISSQYSVTKQRICQYLRIYREWLRERPIDVVEFLAENGFSFNRGRSIKKFVDLPSFEMVRNLHRENALKSKVDRNTLKQKFNNADLTVKMIAKELKMSPMTVYKLGKIYNLEKKKKPDIRKNELFKLFKKRGFSDAKIARRYECHPLTIARRRALFGIKRREHSSMNLAVVE